MNISKKTIQLSMLHTAAQKELESEMILFEAAMYRRDEKAMQNHREKAQALLDSVLDLKVEQFKAVCKENGLEY